MLGKLIKYEYKATGRILLPLYVALIVFAFINKIFMGDFFNDTDSFLGQLPQLIGVLVYAITMIGIIVSTMLIIIQRYRTNLLGDEGYLMNTIPVAPWQNIFSKLFVAISWSISSFLVALISIVILAYEKGILSKIFTDIGAALTNLFTDYGINGPTIFMEVLIFIAISIVGSILIIYASLSLGNLVDKNKILASFGAFIILNIIKNIFLSIIGVIYNNKIDLFENVIYSSANFPYKEVHLFLIGGIIVYSIIAGAWYIICNYVIKNKLNLE